MPHLLEVEDLRAWFEFPRRTVKAVDGVSFHVDRGEMVGIAGESGCGKSVTAQCILRLLPAPGRVVSGDVRLDGRSMADCSREEMRRVRGARISIVLQDAKSALNPVLTTGEQVADVYRAHRPARRTEAWERAVETMRRVGIPSAEVRARDYPHEFSGGMQQRVVIGAALACDPDLIIADEPTTALDVTVQKRILDLLRQVRTADRSVLYISHDLACMAGLCDRILVMYAGQIVESARTSDLYARPLHPYTRGLLACIPPLAGPAADYLPAIPGAPPDPACYPPGCRFAPRCAEARPECRWGAPPLVTVAGGRQVRCNLYGEAVQ